MYEGQGQSCGVQEASSRMCVVVSGRNAARAWWCKRMCRARVWAGNSVFGSSGGQAWPWQRQQRSTAAAWGWQRCGAAGPAAAPGASSAGAQACRGGGCARQTGTPAAAPAPAAGAPPAHYPAPGLLSVGVSVCQAKVAAHGLGGRPGQLQPKVEPPGWLPLVEGLAEDKSGGLVRDAHALQWTGEEGGRS